ncbi:MAG: catechol 1,2-dioxygenase [Deltaproteobacteria bacterium]|nr:catechol 1,2-dioxygenase [Deltaproteobacteria bacterium]
MSAIETGNPRLTAVVEDLLATLRGFIRKHHISHDEYRRAVGFMVETAAKGEIPLLLDVFLEATVDQVDADGRDGTETSVEGPFYAPNAPLMKSPCVLPHRAGEPGNTLLVSGTVRAADGEPVGGAILDMWQSDAQGAYSHFNIPEAQAPWNLRARVIADEKGRFEVQTWVPSPYQIPKDGPTGALLRSIGRHAWRPAHLHLRITHDACETLTTQLFFTGDPWIDSDVVGAVKQSLIVTLDKHEDPADLQKRRFDKPYYTISFNFVLPRLMRKAA